MSSGIVSGHLNLFARPSIRLPIIKITSSIATRNGQPLEPWFSFAKISNTTTTKYTHTCSSNDFNRKLTSDGNSCIFSDHALHGEKMLQLKKERGESDMKSIAPA